MIGRTKETLTLIVTFFNTCKLQCQHLWHIHWLMPPHMKNANISTSPIRTFHLLHCPCNLVAIEIIFTFKLVPFSKLVWLCKSPQKLAWKSSFKCKYFKKLWCYFVFARSMGKNNALYMCKQKNMLMNMRFFFLNFTFAIVDDKALLVSYMDQINKIVNEHSVILM